MSGPGWSLGSGRMAHRPSGPGRIPRRRLAGRAGRAGGRRLAGFRGGTPGAAGVTAAVAGAQTSGEATHYELASGGMGNCSYPSPPAGQLYVALPPSEYGAAAACGSYLQVTGPAGAVPAEV